jgi:hypothetical protein
MKYVVITDGTSTRYEANVIACSNIYEAQQAYKEAMERGLDPSMMEMDTYIDNSILDRYAGEQEPTEPFESLTKEEKLNVLRDIIKRDI